MSAINEAYARIDYGMIQDLQTQINNLKKEINTGVFAKIRNRDCTLKETKFWARGIVIPSNASDTQKVTFGANTFTKEPVVTATVYDPTRTKDDTEGATIILRNITKSSVTLDISRKGKGPITVFIIAIGEV